MRNTTVPDTINVKSPTTPVTEQSGFDYLQDGWQSAQAVIIDKGFKITQEFIYL